MINLTELGLIKVATKVLMVRKPKLLIKHLFQLCLHWNY